jgi:hypothetical protein
MEQESTEKYIPKYTPQRWVLLKLTNKETGEVHQRVFAGWFGGFAHGDSWRLNSGVVDTHEYDKYFVFTSASGKEYICYKNSQGTEAMSMYMLNVLDDIIEKAKETVDIEIVKI